MQIDLNKLTGKAKALALYLWQKETEDLQAYIVGNSVQVYMIDGQELIDQQEATQLKNQFGALRVIDDIPDWVFSFPKQNNVQEMENVEYMDLASDEQLLEFGKYTSDVEDCIKALKKKGGSANPFAICIAAAKKAGKPFMKEQERSRALHEKEDCNCPHLRQSGVTRRLSNRRDVISAQLERRGHSSPAAGLAEFTNFNNVQAYNTANQEANDLANKTWGAHGNDYNKINQNIEAIENFGKAQSDNIDPMKAQAPYNIKLQPKHFKDMTDTYNHYTGQNKSAQQLFPKSFGMMKQIG